MGRIERLLGNYQRHLVIPWDPGLAGPQKVWFAVYDRREERRLRVKVGEFELATRTAGHGWSLVDLTDAFPEWMASLEYRDSYFADPGALDLALNQFLLHSADRVRTRLEAPDTGEEAVVAVLGVGALFGVARVSELVREVAPHVRGRLLVFFPGEYENGVYRLLDARDGWNYLAVPITDDEREGE